MAARRRQRYGGRGGYEPRARIVARAERVFELSVQGRSQRQIASEVGVSQAAVSKILRREEERRLGHLPFDRIRLLARQAARYEHMFTLAAEGLERSRADRHHKQQRQRTSAAGAVESTVGVASTSQAGDPRWIREMARVLAEQRKLVEAEGFDWVGLALALPEDADGKITLNEAALTSEEQAILQRMRRARHGASASAPRRRDTRADVGRPLATARRRRTPARRAERATAPPEASQRVHTGSEVTAESASADTTQKPAPVETTGGLRAASSGATRTVAAERPRDPQPTSTHDPFPVAPIHPAGPRPDDDGASVDRRRPHTSAHLHDAVPGPKRE